MARHVVASVDELPPGARKFLDLDGRPIAIFNIKGEFFGLLNRCPHQGAALCEGPLIGLAQSSDPGEIEYTRLGEIDTTAALQLTLVNQLVDGVARQYDDVYRFAGLNALCDVHAASGLSDKRLRQIARAVLGEFSQQLASGHG